MKSTQNLQSGSVMIYIFIAVALFAAITYNAMRGSRVGTTTLSEDQAKIAASEVIEYGNAVAQAIATLRLRGCRDAEISFETPIIAGYTNGTDTACQVFHTNGGRISFIEISTNAYADTGAAGALNFNYSGRMNFQDIGTTNSDTASSELFLLTSALKKEVCIKINKNLGTSVTGKDTPEMANTFWNTKFQGTYTFDHLLNDADVTGKTEFCALNTTDTVYQYLKVLLAR